MTTIRVFLLTFSSSVIDYLQIKIVCVVFQIYICILIVYRVKQKFFLFILSELFPACFSCSNNNNLLQSSSGSDGKNTVFEIPERRN